MKDRMFRESLGVAVILLFFGVAVQPSIAIVQLEEEVNANTKDYLFQTLIDISNHPDVKKFLEQYENDWKNNNGFVNFDFDRTISRKILFRNPRLFRSLIFTKPSMSYEYLDSVYRKGIKITNILGEEKVLEILASIEVTNPEFFEKLNSIIMNDEELYDNIAKLEKMNHECVSDFTWGFPIICAILLLITITSYIRAEIFMTVYDFVEYYPFLHFLLYPLFLIFACRPFLISNIIFAISWWLSCEWMFY